MTHSIGFLPKGTRSSYIETMNVYTVLELEKFLISSVEAW